MPPHSRNLLQIHAAVVLFGLAGVLGKLLDLSPAGIACGRVALASLALLLAGAFRQLPLWPGSGRTLLAFALLGALLALHWTTFFQSLQVSSVAIALITFATFPVFVALLEPLLFREKLRAADVVLALLALAGVAVLAPGLELGNRTTQGVLWGVAAGLTFALLSLCNRKYARQHPSITIAFYQDLFAAAFLLPFVVRERPTLGLREVLLLLALGFLCTALAHALFIAGLQRIQARTASMIACLEPVYGSVLAALFLGEVPTARTTAGGLLILGVAFYATLRASKGETVGSR
jgi:drug/metabolite transporter (DMT)-like permease